MKRQPMHPGLGEGLENVLPFPFRERAWRLAAEQLEALQRPIKPQQQELPLRRPA